MATVLEEGGEPVNEAERQAIAYLRDHLPANDLVLHSLFERIWANGRLITRSLRRKKKLDDDLPLIAEVYQAFGKVNAEPGT